MANIVVVTTEEQIQEIVFNAISKYFSGNHKALASELPDTLTLSGALKVLEDYGFPTSKAKLYKMTSQGEIPFMKYGNKLVFSRKALVEWAHEQLISSNTNKCLSEKCKR